jgi:2-haloacid dehalogenase
MPADRREFMTVLAAAVAMQRSTTNPESRVPNPESRVPAGSIKALVFDAYGTLFDVLSVTSLCELLFPGSGSALAVTWRTKQLQYSLLRSLMNRYVDFWQITQDGLVYAAAALGLELTVDKRARLMDAYGTLHAFPDVTPGLQQLKSMGLRLAILSNGAPGMLQSATRSAGIADLLDAVISVDEVKVFKPSPRVYELASTRLGLPAGDIGFVSSNSWDVAGAASAGLTAFWIQRAAAEPAEELGYRAARVVHALTDLPGHI